MGIVKLVQTKDLTLERKVVVVVMMMMVMTTTK